MRILGEGYRRVSAKGESTKFEAKQSSKLIFGTLIAGVTCIGSFTMFTETPAYGQVEAGSFPVTNAGGQTDQERLDEFLDWACNVLTDQTLCEKYKDAEGWEDIEIDDIIEWKKANGIEDIIAGDLTLFGSIDVRHIIEPRSASSNINLNCNVVSDIEFSRQASASISLHFDGGAATWESLVFWENMDVYWDAPESSSSPYLAKVQSRDRSSSISVETGVGTADYASTLFWDYMDISWGDADTSTSTQFFARVISGNASANISVSTSVGLAGWASNFVWDLLDINWDKQFAGQIHQGNSTNTFSLETNINSQLIAGWNSETTFVENLNRNWEAT